MKKIVRYLFLALCVTMVFDNAFARSAEEDLIIGSNYFFGRGVTQDYNKAAYHIQEAAKKGNADALAQLGSMYQSGVGVAVNYRKAMECYQLAAAKGNIIAVYNIGVMYNTGLGVQRNTPKAAEYCSRFIYWVENSASINA